MFAQQDHSGDVYRLIVYYLYTCNYVRLMDIIILQLQHYLIKAEQLDYNMIHYAIPLYGSLHIALHIAEQLQKRYKIQHTKLYLNSVW